MGNGAGGRRIILTGMAGTGKSTVARAVASRLGWDWIDTDTVVETAAGCSIAEIFANEGEPAFRERETAALRSALLRDQRVVATGGGAVLSPANRRMMAEAGFVVCLQASADEVRERTEPRGYRAVRPLIGNPGDVARLKVERAAYYDRADWTVHTDALTAEQAADEVVHAYEAHAAAVVAMAGRVEAFAAEPPAVPAFFDARDATAVVRTAGTTYPVYVAWGAIERLAEYLARNGLRGPARVIGDGAVLQLVRPRLEASLEGFGATFHSFDAGESSKSLEAAGDLFDELVAARTERGQPVVAVGGGVAGDLGGFVAATYLRGLPLVQVPTTLLAMVDASIGGKVAVNHREGKNLIGAFHQPRFVLADVSLLTTLPRRELSSGWAEVLKAALILDEVLLERLEAAAEAATALDPAVTTTVVSRGVALKAGVVSRDERESGLRMILNYGHTIGHGIEAATAYGTYLHGEAVAIGMRAAVRLSHWMGLVGEDLVVRQDALIGRYGLPSSAPGVDAEGVRRAMALDKKVASGRIRWVLLEGAGRAVVRDDVPEDLVQRALADVLT